MRLASRQGLPSQGEHSMFITPYSIAYFKPYFHTLTLTIFSVDFLFLDSTSKCWSEGCQWVTMICYNSDVFTSRGWDIPVCILFSQDTHCSQLFSPHPNILRFGFNPRKRLLKTPAKGGWAVCQIFNWVSAPRKFRVKDLQAASWYTFCTFKDKILASDSGKISNLTAFTKTTLLLPWGLQYTSLLPLVSKLFKAGDAQIGLHIGFQSKVWS